MDAIDPSRGNRGNSTNSANSVNVGNSLASSRGAQASSPVCALAGAIAEIACVAGRDGPRGGVTSGGSHASPFSTPLPPLQQHMPSVHETPLPRPTAGLAADEDPPPHAGAVGSVRAGSALLAPLACATAAILRVRPPSFATPPQEVCGPAAEHIAQTSAAGLPVSLYPNIEDGLWILPGAPNYAERPPAWFGSRGCVGDIYLNSLGLTERCDYEQLYRVERPGHVMVGGLQADMLVGVGTRLADRRYLFCVDSYEAALTYGRRKYGSAFEVYNLSARGMPAIPYRLHAATCDLLGDARPLLATAYGRGDVYLDITDLRRERIWHVPAWEQARVSPALQQGGADGCLERICRLT